MSDQTPVDLAPIDTDPEATVDHPDELTFGEAVEGHRLYLAVDDLDDESNGLDQ